MAAAVIFNCITLNTLAANETHNTYDVTMTVTNETVNRTTEKLFGFNQEWDNNGIRRNNWLNKNYSKYDSFNNNFENKTYWFPAMETGEAYLSPTASTTFKYISNADVYGGNLSYTKYGVKSGNDLYANQYIDGILQKPAKAVDYKEGNNFGFISGDILQTGGIDGYFGFNNYFELSKGNNRYDVQDLTVVDDGTQSGNHVAKLAPPVMSSEYTYGGGSYFGKTDVALMDRKTTFKYRLKIDSDVSNVRLSLAKDWNIDWIKDAESSKYCLVSTGQFAREYEANQVMGWFDAVKFKDGSVYLAGDRVGEYEKSKWYTVEYTLDADGDNVSNALKLYDDAGTAVIDTHSAICLNSSTNMGRDIALVKSMTSSADFEFAERSDYSCVICANNEKGTAEGNGTVAYIDDIDFKTDVYYDTPNAVIDPKLDSFRDNNTFAYTRVAGTTANWFKWKKSVGDVKQRERYSRQSTEKEVKPKRAVWGVPEWLKMVDYMNPQAEYSYVINILDSDEDIADLVEYLTADGDINGDGTDWSAVRKADGIAEPARVYMWEIANEPNINCMEPGNWDKKWDKDSYIQRAGEVVEILKRYSPDIKIGVAVNTEYVYYADDNYMCRFNWDADIVDKDWAADIDYLVVHSYNTDYCTEPNYAASYIQRTVNSKNSKNKDIKIAYTEHGTNRPANRENYYQGIGLASALCEAEFFNRVFNEPIIEVANLHSYNLYPGPWGVGYEKGGKYYPGATYMLMDMYAENGVGEVLSSSIDGFCNTLPANGGPSDWNGWDSANGTWLDGKYGYSCSAVKQADGSLNLFINNHRNHTLNLTLDVDKAFDDYSIVEKSVITGRNSDDTQTSFDGYSYIYSDSGTSSLEYRNEMVCKTEYNLSRDGIKIDPYSVTVIKLKNTKVQSSVATFKGQRRIDVSGSVENPAGGKNISLLITDAKSGEIRYVNQTKLAVDGSYRFNFEFDHNLNDCKTLINYCGVLKDISGAYDSVTDTDDMFGITAQISQGEITAEIDNKFNFVNIPYIMLCASYRSNTPDTVNISANAVLEKGINHIQAYGDDDAKYHRLFFWNDTESITPLFKSKTLR